MCDEHRDFKDMKLFYRFRKDDGTFPLDNEAKVFMRGQRIYEKYEQINFSVLPFFKCSIKDTVLHLNICFHTKC